MWNIWGKVNASLFYAVDRSTVSEAVYHDALFVGEGSSYEVDTGSLANTSVCSSKADSSLWQGLLHYYRPAIRTCKYYEMMDYRGGG